MKKLISIIVALVLVLGLAVPAFADVAKPTSHDELQSIPSVFSSVVIEGTTAKFEQDSNGSTIYIRAELPNTSKTEYNLTHAGVVITTTGSIPTVSYNGNTVAVSDVDENDYYYTLNLLNRAYSVAVGGNTYTLAAGLADGRVEVSSSDPLKVGGTLDSVTIDAYGSCQNNPYMGNPYYTEWTYINYFISATLPSGTISSITGNLSLASGATLTGAGVTNYTSGNATFDFSNNASFTVTNGTASRLYRSRVAIDGQTVLIKEVSGYRNYDLNFSEVKASTYYTATGSTVKPKVDEIEAAWNVFITQGYTAPANSSVMSIIMAFDNWARTTDKPDSSGKYYTGTSDFGGGYYLSTLNGLSSSDCGSMAGYMYTDDANGFYNDEHGHSSIPMIGADGYTMTSSTRIVWFYTIDFMNWF